MQTGFLKGLKPVAIKNMAMLMGICYLLGPFHLQINGVLHTLSHFLTTPSHIISHDSDAVHGFVHGHHEHRFEKVSHEHGLIDFVNSLFGASDDDDSNDSTPHSKTKADKHLTLISYSEKEHFTTDMYHIFWIAKKKSMKGHFYDLAEPPRWFSRT